jgi:hypothetical protein
VTPDGTIVTVAGDGSAGPGADGVPAVGTQLDGPVAVAVSPAGGFWVADRVRLRRVGADGVIRAVTSRPSCRHDDIGGPGTAVFAGDGRPARCASVTPLALAALPDGGLLVAGTNGSVRLFSPSGAGLASAAITSTALSRAAVQVNFVSTLAGGARVELLRGRTVVAFTDAVIGAGWHVIDVARPAGSGVLDVRLTVRSDRAAAAAEIGIHLGEVTVATARSALRRFFEQTLSTAVRLGECRRFSAVRVDCVRIDRAPTGRTSCAAVLSLQVRASGLAGFRVYDCSRAAQRPFRRAPRWNTAEWAQRWPPPLRLGVMPAPLLGPAPG